MREQQTARLEEDAPRTLVFVDMLGFANLTISNPNRVVHDGPDEQGFTSSGTGPIQTRITRFQNAIDRCVSYHRLSGDLQAMLFSDCAFLEAGNAFRAALIAIELMRDCIRNGVPVRMGLGRGTFYSLLMATETSGGTVISRSRFVGTAVVFAHAAEQCGGKGMRIFVHPTLEPERHRIATRIKMLALPKPFTNSACELDYLHERRPAQQEPTADAADRELFQAVMAMNDPTEPPAVRRQYTETFKALNRMRVANDRTRLSTHRPAR